MKIEDNFVYFTGIEGNDYFLPKTQATDEVLSRDHRVWGEVGRANTFADYFHYRRPLGRLTQEQSAIVNQHCNPQPKYEHYL